VIENITQRRSGGVRSRRGGTDIRLQAITAYNVDGTFKQTGNVFFQPDVIVNGNAGGRVNVNYNVEPLSRAVIATRTRAKERSVNQTEPTQVVLVFPQTVKDLLPVHTSYMPQKSGKSSR
jgi:hypothetical protein